MEIPEIFPTMLACFHKHYFKEYTRHVCLAYQVSNVEYIKSR